MTSTGRPRMFGVLAVLMCYTIIITQNMLDDMVTHNQTKPTFNKVSESISASHSTRLNQDDCY